MERAGLTTMLVGIVIALAGSLPFMASVITGTATPDDFAGNLMWQAWALGGIVAFVGMIMAALGERPTHRVPGA